MPITANLGELSPIHWRARYFGNSPGVLAESAPTREVTGMPRKFDRFGWAYDANPLIVGAS